MCIRDSSIGDGAFYYCTGLTSVAIPSSVSSIGDSAFYRCTGLTSVAIPSSVASISFAAFYGCTGLTSVTIPASVTSLGDRAFSGCTALTRATFLGDVPTTLLNPFENVGPGFVLHYRPGAAGWTTPTWQASWDGGSATYATSPLSLAAIPASQLPLDILYGSAAKADLVDGRVPLSQLPPFGSSLSEFPPSAPEDGPLWIDSSSFTLFSYVGGTWVQT